MNKQNVRIGRVSNRLPWYYSVADRSSYMTVEIYKK